MKTALKKASGRRQFGLVTTGALVVASMVGTGVFTTTGMLLPTMPSAGWILLCWAVAGLTALCGALAYAELAVALPESGGEYLFLSRLMHPFLGFLAAFVSLIAGFAAPIAVNAIAFGSYLQTMLPQVPPKLSGAALIIVLSLINGWRVSAGARLQQLATVGKLALIVGFTLAGWHFAFGSLGERLSASAGPVSPSSFAVGLLWISFSYSGWNAATYVAGEVKDPARVLPKALIGGTLLVTALYLALNAVMLAAAPLEALAGKVQVGHVAAQHIFGPTGGQVMGAVIALGLVSTIAAMIMTGPRVYEAVGRDMPALAILSRRHADRGPVIATTVQSLLALTMLIFSSFADLMEYIGFTLAISAGLTVSCVFLLRRRPEITRRYEMPGYPFTPLVFIALMVWMTVSGLLQRPAAALAGGVTVLLGGALYWLSWRRSR